MLKKNVMAVEESGEAERPRKVRACLALFALRLCKLA
jgi:hypothetical protein